jgi:hypothetical protein
MGTFADKFTRAAGAAIGLCLVAALIVAARPAGGHGGVLPAQLRFTAVQDGVVAMAPASPRPLLDGRAMRPGSSSTGSVLLRNQTGAQMAVRLRAHPDSTALDGTAHVRLAANGQVLSDGTLQALRQGSSRPLRLAPGRAARVGIAVWIPAATETGYEGRHVAVDLETVEEPAP